MGMEHNMQPRVNARVTGYIAACDPAGFASIYHECMQQCAGFNELSRLDQNLLIDNALNSVVQSGKVLIASVYDGDTNNNEIVFGLR